MHTDVHRLTSSILRFDAFWGMFTMQSRQSKAVYVVADFFAHGSVASCNLGLHKTLKIAFCESPYVSICASCMNKSSIRVTPSKKVAHWP
jgi:hypothetical protein